MSFTQDELQAFHTILEQRLSAHRRELESSFEQRMSKVRREYEQRLLSVQQDIMREVHQQLSEQHSRTANSLSYTLDTLQTRISQEAIQRQHQVETFVERTLAAQLLAMEQLMHQYLSVEDLQDEHELDQERELHPDFDTIEVQTDIHWEDLAEVVEKALDARLITLEDSTRSTLQRVEQSLTEQLRRMREELLHEKTQSYSGPLTNMEEVFASIDHLERIIESMQVAMTANHALLSNRLQHHQQLPLERAHPGNSVPSASNALSGKTQSRLSLGPEHDKQQ